MSRHDIYWVDTFANSALGGAPAVVVLDAEGLEAERMQRIAREFNVGETSFLSGADEMSGVHARARIFTPVEERPYAGAPVLAMAFSLVDAGRVRAGPGATDVRLAMAAGEVETLVSGERDGHREVTLTSFAPVFDSPIESARVLPSLGLDSTDVHPSAPIQVISTGTRQLLACLRDRGAVEAARLTGDALRELRATFDFASLRVFCLGGYTPDGDCYGRHFYAGTSGVSEDPFTGSSAGSMGAYLWHHGLIAAPRIVAEQGHGLGRPGRATLERVGEPDAIDGVRVTGPVTALVRGVLEL